jgi:spore coat polysaccharide biosynthesis protein SpsF (cytidylyltransferase family)
MTLATAIIIQARMGSTRLPGKVLEDLCGRPVLQHVIERCRRIPSANLVVCAVPDSPASDPLAAIAVAHGAVVSRGSETDVLSRYANAAREVGADVVMRVTSDCPLIDWEVCDRVLRLRLQSGADYAANNMPPSFPHGLDCEAFTSAALFRAALEATEAYDREHVTPYLRRTTGMTRINLTADDPQHAHHRWTLDFPEDLAFFRAVFARLPEGAEPGTQDVLAVLAQYPGISDINKLHSNHQPIAEATAP